MAWRYRRSVRFPGGFRINLSRSGVGYSWGFRGFRIGKGAKGQITRTVSIPGTGIYNRTTIQRQPIGKSQGVAHANGQFSTSTVLIVLGLLFFLWAGLNQPLWLLIILLVVAVGSVLVNLGRNPASISPAVANNSTSVDELVHKLVHTRDLLEKPVKAELAKCHKTSSYDDIYCLEFMHLIAKYSSLDGAAELNGGQLFLHFMSALHPRQYRGLSPEAGVNLICTAANQIASGSGTNFLLDLVLSADWHCRTRLAPELSALMVCIAAAAIETSGMPGLRKEAELAQLQNSLRFQIESYKPKNEEAINPNDAHVFAESLDSANAIHSPNSFPIEAPNQGQLADRLLSIVDETLPLFRDEMRRIRSVSATNQIVESDLREVLLHFGIRNGVVLDNAAELYLKIFSGLHPKRRHKLTLDNVRDEMLSLYNSGVLNFAAPLNPPFLYKTLNESQLDTCRLAARSVAEGFSALAEGSGASNQQIEVYRASFT